MRWVITFILVFIISTCSSQTINLHLPKLKPNKIEWYEFRYPMPNQNYFKADMTSWSQLKIKCQFGFRTKNWGGIYLNLYLPPIRR